MSTYRIWPLGFFTFFVIGCAVLMPPTLTDYSDVGVDQWGVATLAYWGKQAGGQDVLSYGGALSIAGLSSGTVLAAASGSGAASGLAVGSAIISWVMAILKPTGHSNAIAQGATIIYTARAKYFVDRTAAGISKTPTDCMTAFAGVYAGQISLAQLREMTARQELAPPDPQLSSQSGFKLATPPENTCGK